MKIKLNKDHESFILRAFGSGYKNYVPLPFEMKLINALIKKGVLRYNGTGYYSMIKNEEIENIFNNLNKNPHH